MWTIRRCGVMVAGIAMMATTTDLARAQDNQPTNQQVMQELESLKAKIQDVDAMKARIRELQEQIQVNTANAATAKAQSEQAKKDADVQTAALAESAKTSQKLSKGRLQIGRTNIFFNGWLEASMNYRQHNELAGPSQTSVLSPFPVQPQYAGGEFRMGPPQTRFGLNTVSDLSNNLIVKGKLEFDLLSGSNAAGTANGSSFTPRVRHAWGEVDNVKRGWHVLLGQAYSLALPSGNITGADGSDSPNLGWMLLPGTEVVTQPDDGAFLGLGTTRSVQFRVVKEIAKHAAVAISLEDNIVNWGGDKGTALAFKPLVSNASYNANTPFVSFGMMPDIIGKVGYDPTSRYHLEAWGILRQYKDRSGVVAANILPNTGAIYTGGGAIGTYIKVVPGKLDLHAGTGYGSFGSQIDGAIPDVTYNSTGKPVAIFDQYLFGELIAHPNRNLDLYFQSGIERGFRAGVNGDATTATAYGYGNPLGSGGLTGNRACTTQSITSLTATCNQDTQAAWNYTFTPVWRVINNNKHGHLDFMPQVQYVARKAWRDQFGFGPHTSNIAVDICFRYWPF